MTVSDLIKSLEAFEPYVQVTVVHDGDNPISDYSEVVNAYEIRGSSKEGIDCVVLVMN